MFGTNGLIEAPTYGKNCGKLYMVHINIWHSSDASFGCVCKWRHATTNFSILAGCALADLGVVGTSADERCVGLWNGAQFPGGVVCYSGVTPGSLAVYVCNSTHRLEGPSLTECQSNGIWTGTVPQCVTIVSCA